MDIRDRYDWIVLGSAWGGWISAAALAKQGDSVLILPDAYISDIDDSLFESNRSTTISDKVLREKLKAQIRSSALEGLSSEGRTVLLNECPSSVGIDFQELESSLHSSDQTQFRQPKELLLLRSSQRNLQSEPYLRTWRRVPVLKRREKIDFDLHLRKSLKLDPRQTNEFGVWAQAWKGGSVEGHKILEKYTLKNGAQCLGGQSVGSVFVDQNRVSGVQLKGAGVVIRAGGVIAACDSGAVQIRESRSRDLSRRKNLSTQFEVCVAIECRPEALQPGVPRRVYFHDQSLSPPIEFERLGSDELGLAGRDSFWWFARTSLRSRPGNTLRPDFQRISERIFAQWKMVFPASEYFVADRKVLIENRQVEFQQIPVECFGVKRLWCVSSEVCPSFGVVGQLMAGAFAAQAGSKRKINRREDIAVSPRANSTAALRRR